MKNKVVSVEQVRWHAQAALNGFETLDLEMAAAEAQSELRALLRLLDDADGAAEILGTVRVEPIIEVERVGGNVERRSGD